MCAQYLYRIQPSRPAMLSGGPTEAEALLVAEHFEYLTRLTAEGIVLLAGRTLNNDPTSFGIVIFQAGGDAEARAVMDGDPAVKAGVFTAELFPYSIALAGRIQPTPARVPAEDAPVDEGAAYRSLFLQTEDLPGMTLGESRHGTEPDPGDTEFARHGCIQAGFNAWNRIEGTNLWRVVDIRWMFSTSEQAKEYHRARMAANSEGLPEDPHAPGIGSEARVYSAKDPFDPSVTMHIFLYVEGRTVAKVFVSGFHPDECLRIVRSAHARTGGSH